MFLFWAFSGVMQGCPLSGSLFVLAFDPFLRKLRAKIDLLNVGVSRACADDVAVVCFSFSGLKDIREAFSDAAKLAALCLRLTKCAVVTFGGESFESERRLLSEWLAAQIPEWSQIPISKWASYLGMAFGRFESKELWASALQKWEARAICTARSGASQFITAAAYRRRILPCLSYVGQFLELPIAVLKLELRVHAALLRLPYCALSVAAVGELPKAGGPDLPLLLPFSLALLARHSLASRHVWRPALERLKQYSEHISFANQARGFYSRPGWPEPPLVSTMAWADAGFPAKGFGRASVTEATNLRKAIARRNALIEQAGRTVRAAIRDACQVPHVSGRVAVQGLARKIFADEIYRPCLEHAWKQRAIRWFGVDAQLLGDLEKGALMSFLAGVPKEIAVQVIRVWSFAWLTSKRMHAPSVLPCPMGCDGEIDCLSHLIRCEILWADVSQITGILGANSMFDRLAFNRIKIHLVNLAIATSAYHSLRSFTWWREAIEAGRFEVVRGWWQRALRASHSRYSGFAGTAIREFAQQ